LRCLCCCISMEVSGTKVSMGQKDWRDQRQNDYFVLIL